MKKTAAILDDDKTFAGMLAEMLAEKRVKYDLDLSIDIYSEPGELDRSRKTYDLLFLDIVMPGEDGISLMERWGSTGRIQDVIYVSAFSEEVFRTFESRPVMFVRKTCLEQDLDRALKSYADLPEQQKRSVLVPEGRRIHFFEPENIMYLVSRSHYVEFHAYDGSERVIRGKLDVMEQILSGYGFIRIHTSCLVNVKYIASVDRTQVQLVNQEYYKISAKYKKRVVNQLKRYLIESESYDI